MKWLIDLKQRMQQEKLQVIIAVFLITIILALSVINIIVNLIVKYPLYVSYKWVIIFVAASISLYLIQQNKYVKVIIWGLLALGTVVIPLTWFSAGGSNNHVEYYVVIIIMISCVVLKRKSAIALILYNIIQIDVLLIIEHVRPELIRQIDLDALYVDQLYTLPIIYIVLTTTFLLIFALYENKAKTVDSLNKELSKEAKLKNILLEIMQETSDNFKIKDVCHVILTKSIAVMDAAHKGSIMSIGNDGNVHFQAAVGYHLDILEKIKLQYKESYLYVATDGKMDRTVMVNTQTRKPLEREKQILFEKANQKFSEYALCAPIKIADSVWGMIYIDGHKGQMFEASDKEFLEIFAKEIEKIIMFSNMMQENEILRNHDYLTNIYNRLHFNEQYLKLVNCLDGCLFSLVAIDLNKFKRINDTYGHQKGDDFLIYFVECARRFLTTKDVFARFGGDEFQLILSNQTKKQAQDTLNHIKVWCDNHPIVFEGQEETVRFSFGIAEYPSESDDFETLLAIADKEMYYYKRKNYH